MKKLIKGLHKFQKEIFPNEKDFFESLVKGQNPEVLFITCSDSRINPNLFTSSNPGDLFILRNAGNIIPIHGTCGSEEATIEFAVSTLGVKDIIVCGHSHCGAIQSAFNLENIKKLPSLYNWIKNNIEPTLKNVEETYKVFDKETILDILIQENVLKQIENIKTHPVVSNAIANNQLSLHAWVYTFETGEIFSFNSKEEQFELLK